MPDPSAPAKMSAKTRPLTLARVEEVSRVTPRMVRVVFGGEGLVDFPAGAFTDHYVKFQLPPAGAPYAAPFDLQQVRTEHPKELWPRTRTYSVRAWDPERTRLTVDFVHHGDTGVAGPWAAGAQPGDLVQLQGPGGAYAPAADADWHLMVGDASVIPAISASLARVPAGVPVHVFLEVDGPEEEQPLDSPGDLHLHWLHRDPATPDDREPLLDAVAALDFPPGDVHAFVHGEASAVRAVRRHLLAERGVPRERLSASGYWKRSRTEEGWRADKREWNLLVEQDVPDA
jgi:NADPH-dependent ferric siderophore reductase